MHHLVDTAEAKADGEVDKGAAGKSADDSKLEKTKTHTHIYIGRCPGSAFVLQTIKTPHRAFLTTCFQIFCPPPLIGSIFFPLLQLVVKILLQVRDDADF